LATAGDGARRQGVVVMCGGGGGGCFGSGVVDVVVALRCRSLAVILMLMTFYDCDWCY